MPYGYKMISKNLDPQNGPGQFTVYQIRIKGHLGSQWRDWFEGLTITLEERGDTLLTGPVIDQAALHGLLKKVRDLGMPLVSVCPVKPGRADPKQWNPPYRSKRRKMNSDRKTAIIVGALFILGFAGIPSVALTGPILNAPDYLTGISAHENQVIFGALFQLIMALACAGIAIGLYPVLRKYDEALALGSVGFRIIESVFLCLPAVLLLTLITLGREYAKAGAPDFQILGTLLLAVRDWAGQGLAQIAFVLGALMYYYIFYRAKFIPRWLSGWGLVAVLLHLAGILLTMFSQIGSFSTIQIFFALPVAANEMVLAIWLIAKGFNPSAITSAFAKADMN